MLGGRVYGGRAGGGHGGDVDCEDGGDGAGVRGSATIRAEGVAAAAGAGAAGAWRSGEGLDGTRRCFGGRDGGGSARAEVSREAAGDASRIEWPGGAAGFVVLEAGRGDRGGFRSGGEWTGRVTGRVASRRCTPRRGCIETGAARGAAAALGGTPG